MYANESVVAQQVLDGLGLVKTVLQQQMPAGNQVRQGLCHDAANVIQPILPRSQGRQRLVLEGRQMRVVLRDIRRVGDDQIKRRQIYLGR